MGNVRGTLFLANIRDIVVVFTNIENTYFQIAISFNQIQQLANNLEIKDSQIKDHGKIFESTVYKKDLSFF